MEWEAWCIGGWQSKLQEQGPGRGAKPPNHPTHRRSSPTSSRRHPGPWRGAQRGRQVAPVGKVAAHGMAPHLQHCWHFRLGASIALHSIVVPPLAARLPTHAHAAQLTAACASQ